MLGVGLIFVGIIYYLSPRIMRQHFEACNQARQNLKLEALQLALRRFKWVEHIAH